MDYNNKQCNLLIGWIIFILLVNCAGAATLNVPADYATIQAAINAASTGDTILVQSGTYYENVNVNKQLTLRGVDTDAGLPVVDASKSGTAITLNADNCILQNFVARNSSSGSSGIRANSGYNTISGNTATGNSNGIYLSSSSSNTISDNNATGNNLIGITLSSSSNNDISGNNATGNSQYGISLSSVACQF
jgi:parallel beta-helix repeat protein